MLVEKKKIINLRKEIYLIIPPRNSKQRQIFMQLCTEKLFSRLNRNYNLGVYSSAKFHEKISNKPSKNMLLLRIRNWVISRKQNRRLDFLLLLNGQQKNILEKKSDAEFLNFQSHFNSRGFNSSSK